MSFLHSKQTVANGIHIPISYEFADATARNAVGSYQASDIGKFCRQLDTNALYWLSAVTAPGASTTPTWISLGGAALDSPNTFTKCQAVTPVPLTYDASIAPDLSLSNSFLVMLTGNLTLDNPTNLVAGSSFTITLTQDETGGRTIAFGTAYKFPGGTAPTLSTAANAKDKLFCHSDNGTTLDCVLNKDFR